MSKMMEGLLDFKVDMKFMEAELDRFDEQLGNLKSGSNGPNEEEKSTLKEIKRSQGSRARKRTKEQRKSVPRPENRENNRKTKAIRRKSSS